MSTNVQNEKAWGGAQAFSQPSLKGSDFMNSTTKRRPRKTRREPAPLSMFDDEKRAEIERLANAPTPPPKWIDLFMARITSRAWYEWHIRRGIDPAAKRPSIPASTRALVIARDGLVCHLCGGTVERTDVHLDHVHPFSLGGGDEPSNLRVAHSVCNIRRGNKEITT